MSKFFERRKRQESWAFPKAQLNATVRLSRQGKIQPMEPPSLIERLFGRR